MFILSSQLLVMLLLHNLVWLVVLIAGDWNTSPLCVAYSSEDGTVSGTVDLEKVRYRAKMQHFEDLHLKAKAGIWP